MSETVTFGTKVTNTVNRFCGPASDGPDRQRWEVYTDARGMNRADVLALIAELAEQLHDHPAPTLDLGLSRRVTELEDELREAQGALRFANDTTEMLLRMRAEDLLHSECEPDGSQSEPMGRCQ